MAKIRSLKAEFFRNEEISAGGKVAKLLAAGLICCVADDEGRFKASLTHLQAEIFTHDRIPLAAINKALHYLEDVDFLRLYSDERLGAIVHWSGPSGHQRVPPTRFEASKHPPPPAQARNKRDADTAQAEGKHAATGIGRNGKEGTDSASTTQINDPYEAGRATPEVIDKFKGLVAGLKP